MSLSHPRLIRLILLFVVLILALPLLLGLHILTEADLRQQYNRAPTALPQLSQGLTNPPAALQQAVQYYSEHMAGVAFMTRTLQQLRFDGFGDPGSPLIARHQELVFLSAFDVAAPPMNNLKDSCRVGTGQDRPLWLQQTIENTQIIHRALQPSARKIGFLIIPSKPVLYHDRLPRGTPASIRKLCAQAAASGELEYWQAKMQSVGVPASYPLALFEQNRSDPAYYPAANFHAEGASAQDAAVSLLGQMYTEKIPWPQPSYTTREEQGDLEYILTFPRQIPKRIPDYGRHAALIDHPATTQLRDRNPAFRAALIYATADPIIGGDAVIIGNSFARHAAPNFAPAFDKTTVFDMATATDQELAMMFTDVAVDADTIIFVLQDTAAKYWLWQRERDVLEALEGGLARRE